MLVVRNVLLLWCIFCCFTQTVQAQLPTSFEYRVYYHFTDKDSLFKPQGVQLTETFTSDSLANSYIKNLSLLLISSGYLAASVDSILKDSTVYHVQIFAGNRYTLNELRPGNAEKEALVSAGYYKKKWKDRALNLADVYALRNRLLDYYENNGYPFAAVSLDSIQLDETSFSASLYVDKSVAYTIDSIRVMGDAVLKPLYLQHYLGIKYGSLYNGEKIKSVDKKIRDLTFVKSVQPADVTMTGSGSVLNVYLNKQRSSKVNFIIGFLPDPSRDGKLQMTGDVDLDLKNMLRSGESLILKWQQLQKGSPRLNLGFNLPYVFKSSFGLEGLFDMYKKDSSFLQLSAQTGLQYTFSASKVGKFVVQFQGSNLLAGGVDTNLVKSSKKLPDIIDMTAVNTGFQVDWYQTDYRYNPSSGFEWNASALVGIKKVKPNQDILSLKDPLFDYASLYDSITTKNYQFNLTARGAKYFLVKKNLVLKVGVQGGFYYSPQIFRNDQYRIGGFRTLRGFDEEGIFTDKYGIGTAELRLISGMNSYLYMFSDFAYTGNSVSSVQNTFISAGIGILLETKVGLLNVSYAAGKRNDVPFNLREASKLHLGYINYF